LRGTLVNSEQRDEAVSERPPPTQTVVAADELLIVNLIPFCQQHIAQVTRAFQNVATTTVPVDFKCSRRKIETQRQLRRRPYSQMAPQVGLEPTTPSVNRVALIWVNKYSLRVSPETCVVAPCCIFSEKLEPINCRAFLEPISCRDLLLKKAANNLRRYLG
jgi:hypothetical protein